MPGDLHSSHSHDILDLIKLAHRFVFTQISNLWYDLKVSDFLPFGYDSSFHECPQDQVTNSRSYINFKCKKKQII